MTSYFKFISVEAFYVAFAEESVELSESPSS